VSPSSTTQSAKPAEIPITTKSPEALEHFKKGEQFFENVRNAEAAREFGDALKLDPDFVQARALYGLTIGGSAGFAELERARAQAAALPEAERLFVAAIADPNVTSGLAAWKQLIEKAPESRAYAGLGLQLYVLEQYAEAEPALRKATELNPSSAQAQNILGYTLLRRGDFDGAIKAFQTYAMLAPTEPNAQDSLAEGLMNAGRFEEAESAFRKATELAPQFVQGWEGVAYTKFYRGDWKGGSDALAKAMQGASGFFDRVNFTRVSERAALAQGRSQEAVRIVDTLEQLPNQQSGDTAIIHALRGRVRVDAGRAREALPLFADALQRVSVEGTARGLARNVQRQVVIGRAAAEAQLPDKSALEKSVADADALAAADPADTASQSAAHLVRGLAAMTGGDFMRARSQFAQCQGTDYYCHWYEVTAAERSGDRAGADAARQRLLKSYERDPIALFVRARLTAAGRNTTN
jgi:Flp pilus assembly protein TadD